MKVPVLFTLMTSTIFGLGTAQEIPDKFKVYQVRVEPRNAEQIQTGDLYKTNDSTILLSNALYKRHYYSGNYTATSISIESMETLKIRRKGNIGKGVAIGFIAGAIAGAIIGFASGDDPPCQFNYTGVLSMCIRDTAAQKALIGGSILAFNGIWIGAAIGSYRREYPILGKIQKYQEYREEIKKCSILQE